MERIATSKRTKQILQKNGLQLKKSLGQHFMADVNILQKMVSGLDVQANDCALEIGPGIGALTQLLAETFDQVVSVEIDRRLIPVLAELFKDQTHVRIVESDFLQVDLDQFQESLLQHSNRIHVVANLPYYITTPIIMKILESNLPWQTMTVMIQKEVADRLISRPGSKNFGSITVAAQFYASVEPVCHVPPSAFVPPPNVDSSVIRFTKREQPPAEVNDQKRFFDLVRLAFTHKRKTLLNNLFAVRHLFGMETSDRETFSNWIIENTGIDPNARAEAIEIAQFADLSNKIFKP